MLGCGERPKDAQALMRHRLRTFKKYLDVPAAKKAQRVGDLAQLLRDSEVSAEKVNGPKPPIPRALELLTRSPPAGVEVQMHEVVAFDTSNRHQLNARAQPVVGHSRLATLAENGAFSFTSPSSFGGLSCTAPCSVLWRSRLTLHEQRTHMLSRAHCIYVNRRLNLQDDQLPSRVDTMVANNAGAGDDPCIVTVATVHDSSGHGTLAQYVWEQQDRRAQDGSNVHLYVLRLCARLGEVPAGLLFPRPKEDYIMFTSDRDVRNGDALPTIVSTSASEIPLWCIRYPDEARASSGTGLATLLFGSEVSAHTMFHGVPVVPTHVATTIPMVLGLMNNANNSLSSLELAVLPNEHTMTVAPQGHLALGGMHTVRVTYNPNQVSRVNDQSLAVVRFNARNQLTATCLVVVDSKHRSLSEPELLSSSHNCNGRTSPVPTTVDASLRYIL